MKTKPVKIVCTLGPATDSEEKIRLLVDAGVDVFRVTFAHASFDVAKDYFRWIRSTEEKVKKTLTILGDLPGPKIRINDMKPDTILEKGQKFVISKHIDAGDSNGCGLNYPSIIDFLQEGAEIFIDDGTIKLIVDKKTADEVSATVLVGGLLRPHKGFSAEGMTVNFSGLSERDKECIQFMIDEKVDAMAISFVQSSQDIFAVKQHLPKDSRVFLVAKIETKAGVENIQEIIDASDGIMVARGDLGLAVPIAQVPAIQKSIINLCVQNAKPVITATQMLESMTHNPIPTRAEVSDVANAILDRTDAVMLSAETAVGKFPIECVDMMVKIIDETVKRIDTYEYTEESTVANSISDAAGKIAEDINAKIIIAFTQSGITARRISRHRHQQAILAISTDIQVIRNLNFSWGVHPQLIVPTKSFDDMLAQAKSIARENSYSYLNTGDKFVVSSGIPFGEAGSTNMILVMEV